MYIPKPHEVSDLPTLHDLIRTHSLGTWATLGEDGLIINHVPFLLDTSRGPYGTLICHVARANPVWQQFSRSVASVVAFQGPNVYVSPSWYPSKHAHGKAVPTWNYTAVHAHGLPVIFEDPVQLINHVTQLTGAHERTQAVPWEVSDAPSDFIQHMARQIVGIEIPISRIIGKWKVSQNRSAADRLGVVAGLQSREEPAAREMAQIVRNSADTP